MKLLLALVLTLFCASARADVRADQLEAEAWNALLRQSLVEAEERFGVALKADPFDTLSWIGIGYAVFWQERFDDAFFAFEVSHRLLPNAYACSGMGHSALGRATRTYVPIDRRQALLERSGAAFAEAQALHPNGFGVGAGMLFTSWVAPTRGAPPLSLGVVAALALLVLFVAAVRRIARKPRAEIRSDARALLIGVLVPYAVSRAIVLLAFLLRPLWRPQLAPVYTVLAGSHHPILEAVGERWDANLYASVALLGYQAKPMIEGAWGVVGQFPLLPVLYRFTLQIFGDVYWSALMLSHAALLVAACAMFLCVRQSDGEALARRATWVLLLVPGALFGSALYAEPLALAGVIAAYSHARQERVGLSIASGMLAGMARINALAAVPMLALFGLGRLLQRGSRWTLLASLGPPLGLCTFMLYTHFELGDAFAYFNELREHRFTNQGPAPTLRDIGLLVRAAWNGERAVIADHNAIGFLALGCLLAYAWAGLELLRRKRFAEASFVITGVMLALGSNLVSQPRYLWLLFPACISFAYLGEKPLVRRTLGVALGVLLFFEASAFAAFYFVT